MTTVWQATVVALVLLISVARAEPAAESAARDAAAAPALPPAQVEEAGRLVASLATVDDAQQTAARQRLVELGPAAVAPLAAVLRDPKAPMHHRMAVTETLAEVGRPARAAMVAALDDPDTFARASATQVLGLIGDTQTLRALLKPLGDADPYVRDKAAWALGRIGNAGALPDLVKAFREDTSLDVRTTAADAIGRLASRAGVEPLVEGLKDPQPRLRAASAEALGLMGPILASGARGELGRKKAAAALTAALADTHWTVRASAAEALGLLRDADAVRPLADLLSDPDVRLVAVRAIGRIGSRAAKRILQDTAANHAAEAVRRAAQEALQAGQAPG